VGGNTSDGDGKLDALRSVTSPAPRQRNLTVFRRLLRSISRSQRGSARCRRKGRRRARLHAHLAAIRRHEIHRLTTRLAKTHGRIVGEGLDAAGMLRQQGLPEVRAWRRGLADAALAELRRQLRSTTGWGTPSEPVPMGSPSRLRGEPARAAP